MLYRFGVDPSVERLKLKLSVVEDETSPKLSGATVMNRGQDAAVATTSKIALERISRDIGRS